MSARHPVFAGAVCALLVACSGVTPNGGSSPSVGGSGLPTAGPGGLPTTGAGGPPSAPDSGSSEEPPPTATGAAGTIAGSFTLHVEQHKEEDTIHQVTDESFDVTIDVRLVRDPSADGEAYVDDGSSYTVAVLRTVERQMDDCMATSEMVANAQHAFGDQPTSYENSIDASVDRDQGTVTINAFYSWIYELTGNACAAIEPVTDENAAGVACPFFPLTARLIEGNGTDQIDTACQLPGGETYQGILTLTR